MSSASIEATLTSQLASANTTAINAIAQVDEITASLTDLLDDIDPNYWIGWATASTPQWADLAVVDAEGKPAPLDLSQASTLLSVGVDRPDTYVPGVLPTIADFTLDAFTGTAPELDLPTKPSAPMPTLPTATAVTLPDMPVAPGYVIPDAPTLASLTIPDDPGFTKATLFSETAPSFTFEAPEAVLNYTEATYTSALQTAADTWLQAQIAEGGTGLADAVEQAMWSRGMTREATATRRNLENAADEFAEANWPMPTGALRARMRSLRADLEDRAEDLSRKISEDQAKLAQTNIHFAIDATLRLEALTLQHFNNIAERTLAYAKAASDVAITIYNAKVAEFNVRLEVYKTKAQIHEINVRTALQDIEAYKALLQGKQIEGTLRAQDVDLYRAQIAGAEALFGLYRSELEGVKAEGDIERLKLDIFREEMNGYIAQLRGRESEYTIYKAEIDGERSKIDAFSASVGAYKANAEAQATYIDAQKAQVEAAVEVEKGRIEQVKTQLAVYLADIDRNKMAIDALLAVYSGDNDTYKTEIERATAEARLALQGLYIESQVHMANVGERNAKYRREADLLQSLTATAVSGAAAGIAAQGSIGAAALSQITTIADLSASYEVTE